MMKQLLSYSVKTLASLMTILKLSLTSNVGYFLEIIATLSETFLLKNKERHFLVFLLDVIVFLLTDLKTIRPSGTPKMCHTCCKYFCQYYKY